MSRAWSWSAKPRSQDAVHAGPRHLVVADGATPLDPALAPRTSDFVASLVDALSPTPGTLLTDVHHALTRAQRECGTHGVTSTLSVVCWNAATVAVAVIADSPVIVETITGIDVITDEAFTTRESWLLEQSRRRDISDLQRRERAARNTADGRWVVSDWSDPAEIVAHLHTVRYPRREVTRVAVCSDGMSAAVDTFGLLTWRGLLEVAEGGGVDKLLGELETLEASDPEANEFPRLSVRDDRSLARARLRTDIPTGHGWSCR